MGPFSKKPGESRMLSSFTYSDAYLPRQEKKKKTRFDGISVIFLNIRDGRFETRSQGWWMKIDTGIREVAPFL